MITYIENFYKNTDKIFNAVSRLDFTSSVYGLEIKNFNMIPDGIERDFSLMFGQNIKVNENSGIFRKSYNPIHFEDYHENSFFICFVALEDMQFKTSRHIETGATNIFPFLETMESFVKKNCFDHSKWENVMTINMKSGDAVFVKPWIWHSLEDKITKVFYLEKNQNDTA